MAVCQWNKFGVCLPDQSSIFTAEARALLLVSEFTEVSNYTKYLVHSDSFSCLQAVARLKTDHPFVAKIIYKMDQLPIGGYDTGYLAMLASEETNKLIRLLRRL